MSDQRKPKLDSLFVAALEIQDPDERMAFLDDECGSDDQLRGEVENLLSSHRDAGTFMDRPAGGFDKATDVSLEATESGLSQAFRAKVAVVIRDRGHSVLKTLGEKLSHVPRVVLRETDQGTSVERLASRELPARSSEDRYQLHGEIARGGMGAIIKGRDADLGRDLAIKVLLDSHKDKPEVIERFVEEAQIGGQLQHPGIVPVYELGQFVDERPFFSMKLVKGKTLAALLTQRQNPIDDQSRMLGIFEQVCQTMAYAHSRGVIHRDLKPANIMVGAFGEVQVMDWGLAKVLAEGGVADEKRSLDKHQDVSIIHTRRHTGSDAPEDVGYQTHLGSVMGTPAYMPPEQALGEIDRLDERADVFGLGAILCEILTGKPPYVAEDGTQVLRQASRGKLEDCFARLNASCAEEQLIRIAKHALDPEPENRIRSAQELAERVSKYLDAVQERLRQSEFERIKTQTRIKLSLVIAAFMALITVGAVYAAQVQTRLAQRNQQLAAGQSRAREREEHARRDEERSRRKAERLARNEVSLRRELQRLLYSSDMQVAHQEFLAGRFERTVLLLDRHRPRANEADLRAFEWYYIWDLCKKGLTTPTLKVAGNVYGVAFSPNGQQLAVSSDDLTVWNLQSRQSAVHPVDAMPWPFPHVAFSAEGTTIAMRHELVEVETLDATPLPHGVFRAFSPNGSYMVVNQDGLRMVDLREGRVVYSLPDGLDVNCRFSPGSDLLAVTSGNEIKFWDVDAQTFVETDSKLQPDVERLLDYAFAPDGGSIASRTLTQVALWGLNGEERFSVKTEPVSNATIDVSPDGSLLATNAARNRVELVDISSGERFGQLLGHSAEVKAVRFSPDGRFLASGSYDGTVKLWTLSDFKTTTLGGHNRPVDWVAFSGDGSLLASSARHWAERNQSADPVKLWDAATWTLDDSVINEGRGTSGAFVPHQRILALCNDRQIDFWDLDRDRVVSSVFHTGKAGRIGFSPNGKYLIAYRNIGPLRCWQLVDKEWRRLSLPDALSQPWGVDISDDEEYFAIGSSTDVKLWKSNSSDMPATLSSTGRWYGAIKFSPSGEVLASAGSDLKIRLWDVRTGKELGQFAGDPWQIAFSPDGKTLATATGTDAVELWDVDSQRLRFQLPTRSAVRSVCFSPDGNTLAAGLDNGSIRLWHASRPEEVRQAGW